jgi:activator of HSP90 ATPase
MSDPIHQEIVFDAPPHAVYEALLDEKRHGVYTRARSAISREPGGTFDCHDGQIGGRQIELVPDRRIVQAWRVNGWPEGVYTLVRFELAAEGESTRLVMDHWGVPEEQQTHIADGWEARYWGPLREYLAG